MENPTEPIVLKRNEFGLLEGITYFFKPDGKVDWRKMVPNEFIVPNKEKTQETDISKLADKDLLILLAGFQYLAELRGYNVLDTTPVPGANETFVAAKTLIEWIPNFETEYRTIVRTGTGDANLGTTKGIFQNFLTTIAENRSFVRAVRQFLKIPIYGQDEMALAALAEQQASSQTSVYSDTLADFLKNNKIGFENFKNKMTRLEVEGASKWESVNDVPESQVMDVMEKVKAALAERAAKKAQAEAAAKSSES